MPIPMPGSGPRGRLPSRRPTRWTAAALLLAGLVGPLSGCGVSPVSEGMARYRGAVERTLGIGAGEAEAWAADAPTLPSLPRRRLRRAPVGEQRIGPFDFLATVGCPLSELVATRNAALGRVLQPTRRLAHELAVLDTAQDCLPTLREDRAERLGRLVEAKRADLGAHVWNAVWLDPELERFLSAGPRTLVGGRDPADAVWQLDRAARAIEPGRVAGIDASGLEQALSELRDDKAAGPVLRELARTRRELDRVAELLEPLEPGRCEGLERRLVRDFRERYLPLQPALGDLHRRGDGLLHALDRLYLASAERAAAPEAMQSFATEVLDVRSEEALWSRYQAAVRRHAEAWSGLLEACGVLPGTGRTAGTSAGRPHA